MTLSTKEYYKINVVICSVYQLQSVISVIVFISTFLRYGHFEQCGIDQSSGTTEGKAIVEAYPWMGLLFYPFGDAPEEEVKFSAVVLITYQFVITTASEIDKYPKHAFRKRSRVVLGQNYSQFSSGPFFRVVQYTYHQDFASKYFATLAIVQLEDNIKQVLMPICAPPRVFTQPLNYINVMSISYGSSGSAVNVYNMNFIGERDCREYYLKSDVSKHNHKTPCCLMVPKCEINLPILVFLRNVKLSSKSMWPRYVSCATGRSGGHCLWKSGTALVVKLNGKWHLLGIGISGPGCEAPARFLDYTKYIHWIRDAFSRIGRVAITRINNGYLIIRRTKSTLQRYGPCDAEERKHNFYTEMTEVLAPREPILNGTVIYNLTLFEKLEYTCVALQAWYLSRGNADLAPELKLRKICDPSAPICVESEFSTLYFHVIIKFNRKIQYQISCFGDLSNYLGAQQMLLLSNQGKKGPPLSWDIPWQEPNEYEDLPPYPPPESNAYPRFPPRG